MIRQAENAGSHGMMRVRVQSLLVCCLYHRLATSELARRARI
jgi:hypothetical protein